MRLTFCTLHSEVGVYTEYELQEALFEVATGMMGTTEARAVYGVPAVNGVPAATWKPRIGHLWNLLKCHDSESMRRDKSTEGIERMKDACVDVSVTTRGPDGRSNFYHRRRLSCATKFQACRAMQGWERVVGR